MLSPSHIHAQIQARHYRLLRFPLIHSVSQLFLTRVDPDCGLINTFWPSQLMMFYSVTVASVSSC
ncbi:unnamed protein product [Hymenolepis diminuta]|uniref:Uncharacterized protein n=1 Tax=Hymenolepis diminuta TaxID=6216 RepID=A0A564YYA9_HYMDI|nr:unnamed protein product [Hymenolepis diminuta]